MGNLTNIAVPPVDDDTFCTTEVSVTRVASGNRKFCGICAIGAVVYCAPYDSDQLLVYDTASSQVSGVDVTGVAKGVQKFSGICAIGTKVFAAPYKTTKLLVYDTVSKLVSGVDVTEVGGTGGLKFSGICAVGTSVYAAPHDSNQLLVYDTVSEQVSGVDVTELCGWGSFKFDGICAIGTSIYAAPYNSRKILAYDTLSKQVSGVPVTGVAQGRHNFSGIGAIGTKVYAAAFRAKQLLVYDTVSKQVSGVDVSKVSSDELKFSGVTAIGTNIYAAPHDSNQLLVYDTVSGKVSGVDVPGVATGKHKFSGICAFGASLVTAPYTRDQLLLNFSSVECRGMKAGEFLTLLEQHRLMDGNTKLHYAAKVGHIEACKALVNGGERVKTRNHAKHVPRDVAAKCGHHEVVKYFEELSPFMEMRGGSGDAYKEAMQDTRHATKIAWYTMPLRGTAGTLGALHSCLAITVTGPDSSSHVYVLEKAATDEACEDWATGVFLSHWSEVVEFIDGDPLHTLHGVSMFQRLTMKDLREVAVGLGEYNVATCNCHHAAQAVYNACAINEHRITELPNSILVQSAGFLGSIGLDVTRWHSPASRSLDQSDSLRRRPGDAAASMASAPAAAREDDHNLESTGLQEVIENPTISGQDREPGDLSLDSWFIDILRENGADAVFDPGDIQVFKVAQSVYEKYEARNEVQEKVIQVARELTRISSRLEQTLGGEQQKCIDYLQNAEDSLNQIRSSHTLTPEDAISTLSDTLRDGSALMASFTTLAMPAPEHSEQNISSKAAVANAASSASQHVESTTPEHSEQNISSTAAMANAASSASQHVESTTHGKPKPTGTVAQPQEAACGETQSNATGNSLERQQTPLRTLGIDAQVSNNPDPPSSHNPCCCTVS